MNVNDYVNALINVCEKEKIFVSEEDPKRLSVDGFACTLARGKKHILIKNTVCGYNKLLVLTREMAHHIFGHIDKYGFRGPLPYTAEDEARLFSTVYTAMTIFEAAKEERSMMQESTESDWLNQMCEMLQEMDAQDREDVLDYITRLKEKGENNNGAGQED